MRPSEPSEPRPRVAVVTVVRDARDALERTIRSVREQTYEPLEHVVVDGDSTDGTRELLAGCGGNLRWTSEPDRGIYDAMNKGVARVASPASYIVFLNADDVFRGPDALARLMGEGRGEDLLYARIERRDAHLDFRRVVGGPVTARDLLYGTACPHQAVFCRRAVFDRVGGFDLSYRISADHDWMVRVFRRADVTRRFVPLVVTVMQGGGVSETRYGRLMRERWSIVRRHYGRADLARCLAHSVLSDYPRWLLRRALRRLGLLNRARALERELLGRGDPGA